MRVAIREGFNCDTIELSKGYCEEIAAENGLIARDTIPPTWTCTLTGGPEDFPMFGGARDRRTK
jgi:hypothetical protein